LFAIHIKAMISASVGSKEIGDMDRDEALKLLKGGLNGIVQWNRRRESGEEIPDLSQANVVAANLSSVKFRSAKLCYADLCYANLMGADLNDADLSGADLTGADLSGANLTGANLGCANLGGAHLSDVQLGSANLCNASLVAADIIRADLNQVDLTGASCGYTIFASLDLSVAQGLDSINHGDPSTIGTDTLFRSKGKIPESFLRGCGVPEVLIKYLPSIIGSMDPIQFYSCFISYSSKDRDFADRLHADLQAKGIRCWFDQEHLKIGEKFRHHIDEAIRVHDKLMVVLSEHSIHSDWVKAEVESALERERREKRTVLFPVRLDDAVQNTHVAWAAHIRRTRHVCDFAGWKDHDTYQHAFTRLLKDLNAKDPVAPGETSAPATAPEAPH
jgi:TIR domain/Pentapeptide repeats (8 copies)